MLRGDDGTLTEIDDEKLYFVVAGMYMGQMLGSVEETSMGLLKVTPRNEKGEPLASDELVNYVIKDESGKPLKEWFAIADYHNSMGGEMDPKYADVDGRKVVYTSLNPVKLLRNANIFTFAVIGVGALLIVGIVFTVRFTVIRIRRKRARKA